MSEMNPSNVIEMDSVCVCTHVCVRVCREGVVVRDGLTEEAMSDRQTIKKESHEQAILMTSC